MSTNESQISSAQLQDEGWTRRFTALGRRLTEVAELYSELGFEVRLEPVDMDQEEVMSAESCKDCFVAMQARTIYTRFREEFKVSETNGAYNKRVRTIVSADLSLTSPIHRPSLHIPQPE